MSLFPANDPTKCCNDMVDTHDALVSDQRGPHLRSFDPAPGPDDPSLGPSDVLHQNLGGKHGVWICPDGSQHESLRRGEAVRVRVARERRQLIRFEDDRQDGVQVRSDLHDQSTQGTMRRSVFSSRDPCRQTLIRLTCLLISSNSTPTTNRDDPLARHVCTHLRRARSADGSDSDSCTRRLAGEVGGGNDLRNRVSCASEMWPVSS